MGPKKNQRQKKLFKIKKLQPGGVVERDPDQTLHHHYKKGPRARANGSTTSMYGREIMEPSKVYLEGRSGVFLPTNSQASEFTFIDAFITWAIVNGVKVNLSHMMLYQKNKLPYQYGMILSHLLVNCKGVPVLENQQMIQYKKDTMIGRQSMFAQGLSLWEGELLAKWEVFERFEFQRDDVWSFNICAPPVPPLGWLLSTVEPLTYPQPPFVPSTEAESSHGSSD
ncbi:hypothetical protein LIER_40519 [Lithospermum erythrorhizon]|uniref:Uncharacterized protein n=1 Tax=Lithospermum erythrorhizon TaxID=34254 RepID=A0AAV3QZG3_LITER